MWSAEKVMQSTEIIPVSRSPTDVRTIYYRLLKIVLNANFNVQALVNVPSLSERTIRRDIEKSDISVGPQIQVCIIHKNPDVLLTLLPPT